MKLGQRLLEESKGCNFKQPLILIKDAQTKKITVDVNPSVLENEEDEVPRTSN